MERGDVNGQDMYAALMDAMDRAKGHQGEMVGLAKDAAMAEREYRKAKRLRILWERAENKTPVSIISDIVTGYEDISDLRVERECAEAMREANREALLLAKKEIDVLREIISREWSANGM